MNERYEYEIVRHGEGIMYVKKAARNNYEEIIKDYASRGWRLVTIVTPGVGAYGATKYFDLVFERRIQ